MPRIPVHNIGAGGTSKDVPAHLLPPELWSDAQNVRFQDNKALKFTGHSLVFDPPSVAPNWAKGVATATDYFILYTGLASIFTVVGATHSDITRISGPYTGTIADDWNGDILGGIPVITNGVDLPQAWNPVAAATKLVDLVNWPAADRMRYIRSFKSFLVALYVTKGGTVSPHMVKWSHPADPGALPSSWDQTDATKDAGEKELDDTQAGVIQDAERLRDILVIYKDNATWGMQHVGGRFIFRFFHIFTETGILAHRCVAPLRNNEQHFVATGDDLIVHNGQSAQSVIDKKWKRFLANNLDTTNFGRSFVVKNPLAEEMWFCFPETGSVLPTLALVWNRRDNTIGVRQLQSFDFIASAVVDVPGTDQSWDADTASWDSDTTQWGSREFNPQSIGLLACDATNTKLFKLDDTNQFNGAAMTAFLEREGLALIGVDRQGNPKSDVSRRKLLTRIWIKGEGDPFEVRAGSQEELGGAITFQAAKTFTPGVDRYLDFVVNGPLLAVRFQSSTNVAWQLHGYDLDIQVLGEI
ncbi:MAG: hypothetical protein ACE5HV_00230 [Acidobacteriota bacterium]